MKMIRACQVHSGDSMVSLSIMDKKNVDICKLTVLDVHRLKVCGITQIVDIILENGSMLLDADDIVAVEDDLGIV